MVSVKKNLSPFEKKMWYFGLPLSLMLFLFVYNMPTPAGLTYEGKMAMGVFASALILWITNSLPTYVTALAAIVTLATSGGWTESNALGVLGYDVIWLMVAAFIITSAMEKSGLARRMALFLISKFGRTTKMVLATLIFANFIIAFVVPSTTARAAIMFPIVMLVAEAYGVTKDDGDKNLGKLLSLQGIHANFFSTSAIITGTSSQILAAEMIRQHTGEVIGWSRWFIGSLPIAITTLIVVYLLGFVLFKPQTTEAGAGMQKLIDEYNSLGKMKVMEYKALVIFIATVFLWATDKWHMQMFGFKISLVMVAILAAVAFFMPYIGIIEWKEAKIPWDLMLFSAGCYAVGTAINKVGVSEWALGGLFAKLGVENMSFLTLYAVVILISSMSHFVFTSKTVRTMVLIPTVLTLADVAGVSPLALALPAAYTICDTITLPPHGKVNLIYLSSGYFTVFDKLKYGLSVLVIKWGIMILASLTWFKVVGIV